MKQLSTKIIAVALSLSFLFFASCAEKTEIAQTQNSAVFTQDYNPKFLDVLWVIDDRSPMHEVKAELIASATQFFKRLGSVSEELSYRMAFTTADMWSNQGRLKPSNFVLTGTKGNLNERASLFASVLNNQVINLKTGAESKGLLAARVALSNHFSTAREIPLVIIFISDADDRSDAVSAADVIDEYAAFFTSLKAKPELLRVYSINYVALQAGDDPDEMRCATRYNADIDKAGFEDRYFKLANKVGGKTGNLCSATWANDIDLSGLRLKELPRRFKLEKPAQASTLKVTVSVNGVSVAAPPWHFEEATNEIVFDAAPPAGTVIQVSFVPR